MFCHIFEKYQGYFFAKKGVGGGGCFAKFENYLGTFLRWRGWVVVKGMIFENPSYVLADISTSTIACGRGTNMHHVATC